MKDKLAGVEETKKIEEKERRGLKVRERRGEERGNERNGKEGLKGVGKDSTPLSVQQNQTRNNTRITKAKIQSNLTSHAVGNKKINVTWRRRRRR